MDETIAPLDCDIGAIEGDDCSDPRTLATTMPEVGLCSAPEDPLAIGRSAR